MDSGLAFDETEIELFDAFVRDYKSLIDDNTKSILITNDLGQSTKFKKYYIRITNTAIDYRQQDHNETNKYFLEFILVISIDPHYEVELIHHSLLYTYHGEIFEGTSSMKLAYLKNRILRQF